MEFRLVWLVDLGGGKFSDYLDKIDRPGWFGRCATLIIGQWAAIIGLHLGVISFDGAMSAQAKFWG
jgi:hypothetical protein